MPLKLSRRRKTRGRPSLSVLRRDDFAPLIVEAPGELDFVLFTPGQLALNPMRKGRRHLFDRIRLMDRTCRYVFREFAS